MTIRKADVISAGAAVLVVVGVSLLPSPKDRNPPVPSTFSHQGIRIDQECLSCHGARGIRPLAIPPHPKRQDCLQCHRTTS